MKISIDMGHALYGPDYGAVGIKDESQLTREVGKLVIDKLERAGYKVVNCTMDKAPSVMYSLQSRVNKANIADVGLFVSIHFNAGGGNGVEIYTYGGKKIPVATDILQNISSLGFPNRGIKDGSSLYVIRNTKATSLLVECAFVDSKHDMSIFNAEKMADAIVKGIEGNKTSTSTTNNNSTKPSISNTGSNMIKRLQKELNVQFGKNLIEDGILGSKTISNLIDVSFGARGNITKIIQELLISKGYNVGSFGVDGIFGKATKNAVLAFQKANTLVADRIVGKNTWIKLLS